MDDGGGYRLRTGKIYAGQLQEDSIPQLKTGERISRPFS